jgi:hypothetical protein
MWYPARVSEAEFTGLIFSSSVALEAILFGVFGVLYSVYALYLSLVTEANPTPAPICRTIRLLCRILAGLMALSDIVIVASAFQLATPTSCNLAEMVLFAIPIVGMLGIAIYMAFFAME